MSCASRNPIAHSGQFPAGDTRDTPRASATAGDPANNFLSPSEGERRRAPRQSVPLRLRTIQRAVSAPRGSLRERESAIVVVVGCAPTRLNRVFSLERAEEYVSILH